MVNRYRAVFEVPAMVTIEVIVDGDNQQEALVSAHDALYSAQPGQASVVALHTQQGECLCFERIPDAAPAVAVVKEEPPTPALTPVVCAPSPAATDASSLENTWRLVASGVGGEMHQDFPSRAEALQCAIEIIGNGNLDVEMKLFNIPSPGATPILKLEIK